MKKSPWQTCVHSSKAKKKEKEPQDEKGVECERLKMDFYLLASKKEGKEDLPG